jgi:rRNA maturation RNase YbeY
MANISFFSDNVEFSLSNETGLCSWLNDLAKKEGEQIDELNVIFVSDNKLLEMNKQFLNHDYYTDIITFPNKGDGISGELYISIDRVRDNAIKEKVEFVDEVHRVIAHGLLHLLSYDDKSDEDMKRMRSLEDFYLNLRTF